MGLFASPAYLKKRGTPRSIEDLSSHELVGFRSLPSPVVLENDTEKERVTMRGPVDGDDLLFVRSLLLAGAGIGLLPLFLVRCTGKPQRDELVRVLPAWMLKGPALHVVAPSARHEPRRVKLFRDFLLSEAKRLGFDPA
jgi:DNA-binding transcriptional LysR family regulator